MARPANNEEHAEAAIEDLLKAMEANLTSIESLKAALTAEQAKVATLTAENLALKEPLAKHVAAEVARLGIRKEAALAGGSGASGKAMNQTDIAQAVADGTLTKEDGARMAKELIKGQGEGKLTRVPFTSNTTPE